MPPDETLQPAARSLFRSACGGILAVTEREKRFEGPRRALACPHGPQLARYPLKEYAASSGSVGRRRVVQGLLAVLFAAGFAPGARGQKTAAPMPIVRISRGSFAPEKYEILEARLDAAQKSLIPAIRNLAGCLHYFAAIDRESSSMVNVSVWRTLADAQQMQSLAPMLALAEDFTREGVRFERPVINYETLWTVD